MQFANPPSPPQAWYPYDMSPPYPSPAPSDPFPMHGPSRPHRRPSPYDRPPPSPTLSTDSSNEHSPSPALLHAVPRRDTRVKHTKHRLRDVDRKNICIYHIEHPHARQEDIGAFFNVERSTISKILKFKDRWLALSPEGEANEQTTRHRPTKFPEIENYMCLALQEWTDQGVLITDNLIRTRALAIAQDLRVPLTTFKGSSGWVENFKARQEIRRGEWGKVPAHGGNTLTPPEPDTRPIGILYDELDRPILPRHAHTPPHRHPPADAAAIQHSPDSYDGHGHANVHTEYVAHQHPDLHYAQQRHQRGEPTGEPPEPYPPNPPADTLVLLGVTGDPPPPTVHEADVAMSTVMAFINRCAPDDFLLDSERQTLIDIKCALFQLVSGIPFQRDQPRPSPSQ